MTGIRRNPDRNARKRKIEPGTKDQDQNSQGSSDAETTETVNIIKRCKKCLNPIKGHPLPTGEACDIISHLSPLERDQISNDQKEVQLAKSRSKKREQRQRRSSEQIQMERSNDRQRMASNQNKEKNRKRKAASRLKLKRKMSAQNYTGWCDPEMDNKPDVEPLKIAKMDEICVDCGALMFPFEIKKKKKDGSTFSLCCGYGK